MRIDLITGHLGAGKTTLIKRYANEYIQQGRRICIVACDYGAINVDRVIFLNELGDKCDLEMVTAGDTDSHIRRLKAKLISLGMLGYDRVILEPSGVFDVDDFFALLEDDPLDRWYQIGSVIDVVDPNLAEDPEIEEEYLLASQASSAGLLLFSKMDAIKEEERSDRIRRMLDRINQSLARFHCDRRFTIEQVLAKEEENYTREDIERIRNAGYRHTDMQKLSIAKAGGVFGNLFYYHISKSENEMRKIVRELFSDRERFGKIIRIKGYMKEIGAERWLEMNITAEQEVITPCDQGQEVIIVIGENLNEKPIGEAFGEHRSVMEYEV